MFKINKKKELLNLRIQKMTMTKNIQMKDKY